ncbi:hypothetical protein MBEHAL_0768 [Halarchaeum acidiphilum MH1-52-1]|uniref:Uncharacterized protein n=1 Tax=Halarchaeum acidiphilum MH1-52-1 TaxID=1261545 RepID=U3AB64_9EURY|nr:hypothetical protein [Halarchaeum acidiphilum]GAD52008.1 hypothetical protein MBEHAL_0768 [Halarchaeum acidiphilum MH1-52-1]
MLARVDGVSGETVRTSALDLRETDVTATEALAAIRDPEGWIRCPTPTAMHEHVGLLDGPRAVGTTALVAAARSRGYEVPEMSALDDVRAALAGPVPDVRGLRDVRERIAALDEEVAARRERVERLGGMVAAFREVDAADDGVRAAHRSAAAALADVETDRIAAAETYGRLRREARATRDERERRLRLEDEERRLRRARDASLAAAIRPSYERARRAVPGGPWCDVLALARVARTRAPLVLVGGPFERRARAAACLDASVVLVSARV